MQGWILKILGLTYQAQLDQYQMVMKMPIRTWIAVATRFATDPFWVVVGWPWLYSAPDIRPKYLSSVRDDLNDHNHK